MCTLAPRHQKTNDPSDEMDPSPDGGLQSSTTGLWACGMKCSCDERVLTLTCYDLGIPAEPQAMPWPVDTIPTFRFLTFGDDREDHTGLHCDPTRSVGSRNCRRRPHFTFGSQASTFLDSVAHLQVRHATNRRGIERLRAVYLFLFNRDRVQCDLGRISSHAKLVPFV